MTRLSRNLARILYENKLLFSIVVVVFILGFLIGTAASIVKNSEPNSYVYNDEQIITTQNEVTQNQEAPIQVKYSYPQEQPSPKDRVPQDKIFVYNDHVLINIEDAEWATFTDTNSMDPVIDAGANAIELVPKSYEDLQVGDIISYQSEYADGTIIHRITEIGEDDDGWYCRTKGDNIASNDPGKIRFSQVKRVVVAIIY